MISTASKPLIAPDNYRVCNDLNTYVKAKIRPVVGAILVDKDGIAEGVITDKCYGRNMWFVSDGKVQQPILFPYGATVAIGIETEWA
jgi:hypothetical protein